MENFHLLTEIYFFKKHQELEGKHWEKHSSHERWAYHAATIEIIRGLPIINPEDVLEMGTMGITCVNGSQTIDYTEKWNFPGKNPTYLHDARKTPWPFEDKQFELFIALRVFQHLAPVQEACIKEAHRIAKRVIIVTPEVYNISVHPQSKGIAYEEFLNILNQIHPNIFLKTNYGDLYYWDTENPANLNLKLIMENYNRCIVEGAKKRISFVKKVKGKLKSFVSRNL